MRRALASVPVVLGLAALAGCAALPPTGMQRAQQTAQDFNLDSRFARGELVSARIDPAERDEYSAHHKAWGTAVRIADIEMSGIRPHGDADAEVYVRVSWYRMDEQELRSTTLKQSWHSKSDAWLLVAESRFDGDIGLLGETVVVEAPAGPRPKPQFPTVQLTGAPAATASE